MKIQTLKMSLLHYYKPVNANANNNKNKNKPNEKDKSLSESDENLSLSETTSIEKEIDKIDKANSHRSSISLSQKRKTLKSRMLKKK